MSRARRLRKTGPAWGGPQAGPLSRLAGVVTPIRSGEAPRSFLSRLAHAIFLLTLLIAGPALATPREGFYKGPYLTLLGGAMQLDWDINQRTQLEEARGVEPVAVLGFGWNIWDWFAPELLLHYTTTSNGGRREHIGGANVGACFTWVAPFLNKSEKWYVLPFIRPGAGMQLAQLPGDPDANDDRVMIKGLGPSIGAGVRVLFNKYLYLGIEAHEEFLFNESKRQQLTAGGTALIYNGGWKRQFKGLLMVGVHY